MKQFLQESLAQVSKGARSAQWSDKRMYANYLAQTFYYVSHSTRLLAAAASRFSIGQENYHRRFLDHTAEEKSHQLLALHDLKALGCSLSDYPELPVTRAFYESQYYKIERQDPSALLGYILALEGYAVFEGIGIYQAVSNAFGKNAATFLKVHSDEDPDHLDKAIQYSAPLTDLQKRFVSENIEQSCYLLTQLIAACHQNANIQHFPEKAA